MENHTNEPWKIVIVAVGIVFVIILLIRFIIYNKGKIRHYRDHEKPFK